MNPIDRVFIYGLMDPDTMEVRYIGKAVCLKQRLRNHLNTAKREKSYKDSWIKSLIKSDRRPIIQELEVSTENNWPEDERWWISYMSSIGCRLTNLSDGGMGGRRHHPESLKKMKGKIVSPETGRKISLAKKGKKMPLSFCLKQRARKWSDAQRAKVAKTKALNPFRLSPEQKAAISLRFKAMWATPEFREKYGGVRKGMVNSEETRRKISESNRGKKWSAEERVNHEKANAERKELIRIIKMSAGAAP